MLLKSSLCKNLHVRSHRHARIYCYNVLIKANMFNLIIIFLIQCRRMYFLRRTFFWHTYLISLKVISCIQGFDSLFYGIGCPEFRKNISIKQMNDIPIQATKTRLVLHDIDEPLLEKLQNKYNCTIFLNQQKSVHVTKEIRIQWNNKYKDSFLFKYIYRSLYRGALDRI